jgi:amino acid adenylation domain-containing protein
MPSSSNLSLESHPTTDQPLSPHLYEGKCLHQLFESQQTRTPDALALCFAGQTWTYRAIETAANHLACYLVQRGVGPEKLVAVCLNRTPEMLISLLAVLKTGGAYVPLDPAYPSERIAFMLADSQASLLLTEEQLRDFLPAPAGDPHRVVAVDTLERTQLERQELCTLAQPDHLAYVIYTSGSTGKPKGVAITHRSAVTFAAWAATVFQPEDFAGVLATTSICFDLSIFELFVTLAQGGTIILAHDAMHLLTLPEAEQVTFINTVPSAMLALVQAGGIPASVRTVNLAGEPLKNSLAQAVYDQTKALRVFNLYGPSEDTTYSTFSLIERGSPDEPTIGQPIRGTQAYILDEQLCPVPSGEVGELYLGGAGLARGYLNRPSLTAERFLPDPFSEHAAARLYRTGDLVSLLPTGELKFLGRADHQVKIRGFRIELGEIEAVLSRHPAVQEAVVTAQELGAGDRQLVAYVVPRPSESPTSHSLRQYLHQSLPDYMVPARIVRLEALPLTPNGKIDRRALPQPTTGLEERAPYQPPRNEVEAILCHSWSHLFGLSHMGIEDNFFDLGGHSLLAARFITQTREKLQVELQLSDLFAAPTISQLAGVINSYKAQGQEPVTISPAPIMDDYPLSFSQERVWFIQQMDSDNIAYQFQSLLRLTGDLDLTILQQTLNKIVERHEIFRTTYHVVNDRPVQKVNPPFSVPVPLIDLRHVSSDQQEIQVQNTLTKLFDRHFELARLPLIEWHLIQLGDQEYILTHVEHHLVHDGWSYNVFLRDFLEIYRALASGSTPQLAEMPIQFKDYCYWEREWVAGPEGHQQLAYWQKQLTGSPALLELATDLPRPPVQTFRGLAERLSLPVDLSRDLLSFVRHEGVTLYMGMLSAFAVLLHHYSGREDINVGAGMANRRWRESEPLIGMIVNNVVLRNNLSGAPTFRELLQRTRQLVIEAYQNQDVPFDKVVEALQPPRTLSYNPLFQVAFSFHHTHLPELNLPGLTLELTEAVSNHSSKFDLNIIVIPRPEQLMGVGHDAAAEQIIIIWEYNTDLFRSDTMTQMVQHYQNLLRAFIANPDLPIDEVSLLRADEQQKLLVAWNQTARDYPAAAVPTLFNRQAQQTPQATALKMGDRQMSYAELNERANQLAVHLHTLGVQPESRVGICLERSPDLIVGILAILKAGGAYVPLDPTYPPERLAFMMADAQIGSLVTHTNLLARLPESNSSLVCLDIFDWSTPATENPALSLPALHPDNLAYIMYTSGSTGQPKGVAVTHRNIVRLVQNTNYVHLDADEVFLQFAPISFDASTFEIWGALLNGAQLVLFPGETFSLEALAQTITTEKITTLWLTAGLFHQMVEEQPEALRQVRQLLAGGDVLSVAHVQQMVSQPGPRTLINGYGPTECTTFSTCYPMTDTTQIGHSVSIGRPIANAQTYILDSRCQPTPPGVPGELYIGGDGLARGYLNRPARTAQQFVPNPFSPQPGGRLYRTGDLARYHQDGTIEFMGRIDTQVKIRGFRIELGEIETVLARYPGVQQVVVVARQYAGNDKRLVAYLVVDDAAAPPPDAYRDFLKNHLPGYMIPSYFVALPEFPLNPNGKVDRQALPDPEQTLDHHTNGQYVPPSTPIEATLTDIWSQVLGREPIGIHDNFFDLGGHSLLATRVVSRMRELMNTEVSIIDLFERPTIHDLADALIQREIAQTDEALLADMLAELPPEQLAHWLASGHLSDPATD